MPFIQLHENPKAKHNFIGKSWIKPSAIIDISGDLIIEESVSITDNCIVYTHTHQFHKKNWQSLPVVFIPLIIGKFSFIGAGSIITPGVESIGEYSVIGCGSVVTQKIPPMEIWAGNPAKKIGDVEP